VNPGSLLITIVYTGLLAWGFSVGARQIYQGFRRPQELLNPLFANRAAIRMFTLHIFIVTADLFVVGPLAIAHKSTLWYWGGRIALLSSSLPIATYLNRNPQSFGKLIGRWVVFRNFFEYTMHVLVAALAVSWFRYYMLLWWLVAYRYLDVGPRRLLQKLYNTPEKKAARPWAPVLNWAVIVTLYILAFLAVYNRQILFAKVPHASVPLHVPAHWEIGLVWGFNLALVLTTWVLTKKYTDSLLPATPGAPKTSSW
jgi:predicted secreted protein